MRSLRAAWVALLSVALGPAAPAPAAAGDRVSAQVLFEAGVKLMDEGDYAAAQLKLEESYRQDPAAGTQYKLAICYESTGRFASAWVAWKEVADALDRADDQAHAKAARKRADLLVPKLAYLKVMVTPEAASTDSILVLRDGVEIGTAAWDTSLPVDPGAHRITATAPKKKLWETSVSLQAGATPVEVRVPALQDAPPPPSPGLSPPRIAAIVVGSIGVLGFGIGSGFGGAAIAKWQTVRSSGGCDPEGRGEFIPKRCDPKTVEGYRAADDLATASDVAFVIGGVAVAAAAILWFTEKPKAKAAAAGWFVPVASTRHIGAAFGGRF